MYSTGGIKLETALFSIMVYPGCIVWVNTQYCGIDDTATTINKWIIIYTTGDVFNGRYRIGDGMGDGFNGKGGRYFELFSRMVYPG